MQNSSNQNHPNKKRRLLFSVIIKSLIILGTLFLIVVFVKSLFAVDSKISDVDKDKSPLSMLELSEMQKGQIRKTRWNNKEVAVLLRQFPEQLKLIETNNEQELHASIKPQLRSIRAEYFVHINTGDSKSCPLYYAGGVFKDVCSSNKYDEAGRALKTNPNTYMIEIPPHYFDNETVIFGQWMP